MKFTFLTIFLLLISISAKSQNYTRDAGLRFGDGFAATYRQFNRENRAIELFISYQENGMRLGGMRQIFSPALTAYSDNFKIYYGYGVHTGFTYTNQHKVFNRVYRYSWTFSPLFGMDGIVGLEYYFPDVPIMVSADIKPYFEFSLNRIIQIRPFNMSLSVKYLF